MKFYEFIQNIQKENPDKVVMVKGGAFYNAIGRDAIVLEKVLGFKRTCHSKLLCKCGMPVKYVKENMEKVRKRLEEKNIGIIIIDEKEGGRYRYNNKTYDILLEIKGESIKENRTHINCIECKNNIYSKDINKYVIKKEEYDRVVEEIIKTLNKLKK